MSIRKGLRSIHKGLGLVLILLLMVQSLSGIALVYRDDIEGMLADKQAVEPTVAGRFDIDRYLQLLASHYPSYQVTRFEYPHSRERPLLVHLKGETEGSRKFLFFDPYTGEVLRELSGLSLLPSWLFELHKSLTAGYAGAVVIAAEGVGLLFLMISGAVLWWPTRGALSRQFTLHGATAVVKLNLHRVTGVLGFPVLFPLVLTGTVVALNIVSSGSPSSSAVDGSAEVRPINHLVEAQIATRAGAIRDVRLSRDQERVTLNFEAPGTLRPLATDRVYISRHSAALTGEQLAGDLDGVRALYAWMYPLHSGKFGGVAGKVLANVAGLVMLLLAVLGLLLYLERRKLAVARSTPRNMKQTTRS